MKLMKLACTELNVDEIGKGKYKPCDPSKPGM